ncbi:hypothetical protein C1Y63_06750 [Corynebacterium sp. 13CS0277]|nr:hypothetical protein C1Y63_06750 [Corynebacterium sp. 13CS0277]
MWTCLADDPDRMLANYEITAEPFDKQTIQRNSDVFRRDLEAPRIPGTYLTHNYSMNPHEADSNCQVNVDTPRGRVAVSHENLGGIKDFEGECALAIEFFHAVFDDPDFLRALYGDAIPLKHHSAQQGGDGRDE